MKKLKNKNVITLITLVVTIIVLLILAGVTISLLSSDKSVIEGEQEASRKYSVDKMNNKLEEYTTEKSGVEVGDYIKYDAGNWTETDLDEIINSPGKPTYHSSVETTTAAKPDEQGQFGGFTLGQSRNTNSIPYNSHYKLKYSGWRVWDIATDGTVTIISAGHPETYYHNYGSSLASVNILTQRDCSMYENKYAQAGSAKILTGEEVARWYNKQYNTSYIISRLAYERFSKAEPISVLENGLYYWLASACDNNYLYDVNPNNRSVGNNYNNAFRCARINYSKV